MGAPPAPEEDPVLLPLLFITPAVAFIVTLPIMFAYALVAAVVALLAAAVVGSPVLAVARKLGLRGFLATTALGCVAGAAPLALVGAVATIWGERFSGSVSFIGLSTVIGGATGGVYSSIHDSVKLAPVAVRRRVLAILAVAVLIPIVAVYWIR